MRTRAAVTGFTRYRCRVDNNRSERVPFGFAQRGIIIIIPLSRSPSARCNSIDLRFTSEWLALSISLLRALVGFVRQLVRFFLREREAKEPRRLLNLHFISFVSDCSYAFLARARERRFCEKNRPAVKSTCDGYIFAWWSFYSSSDERNYLVSSKFIIKLILIIRYSVVMIRIGRLGDLRSLYGNSTTLSSQ